MNNPFLSPRLTITPIVLGAIFGLASGAVGTLLALAYWWPLPVTGPTGLALRPASRAVEEPVEWATVRQEAMGRAAAVIYPTGTGGSGNLAGAFLPAAAVGAGAVLTSDGWIISQDAVLAGGTATRLTAVVDGRSFPVRAAVRDSWSGGVFLKVDGLNLPVVSFGDDSSLKLGDRLYAHDPIRGLRPLTVIGKGDRPAETWDDFIQSSERYQDVWHLSGEGPLSGAAVMDSSGLMVGFFEGNSAGAALVPLSGFYRQISTILRDGAVFRPYLGIRYVDLSRRSDGGAGTPPRGAMIAAPGGNRPAVDRRSPAETAGFRAGDVILAVNDEEISAKRPLSDLLSEYDPGAVVSILYRRGRLERTAEVTLGKLP